MCAMQTTYSPVDGRVVAEREQADAAALDAAVAKARRTQADWHATPVAERARAVTAMVDAFLAEADAAAEEITWQMGRPISHAPGELRGFEERARHMIAIAPKALADIEADLQPGFRRFVRREPLGVVAVIAPWNYPLLTSVNAVVPALMAGNAVILKPSHQTPLSGERYARAAAAAGLPDGLVQVLHLDHAGAAALVGHEGVDFACFTGSVEGGHAVQRAAAERFIGVGLELGGKDPAYVRADANFEHAVENVVDGAFFNAGQSCCGIERVYVDAGIYDRFVEAAADLVGRYVLDDPTKAETNLGPMVRAGAADVVRKQVADARAAGARALVDTSRFAADTGEGPYLAPQVLVDVDHTMAVMREESFGPVVGIMKVASDDEAVALMNDSDYGLTASIWTSDADAALAIGERVETGTWFMNRCDYLDPALAWTGVKNSGRGATLSAVGYEHLTRPKSFHMRVEV